MNIEGLVGPQSISDGSTARARMGRRGELIVSQLQGRYTENTLRGNVFMATAIVTAPVIFSTAAGTGGPLLWNGSSNVNAVILGVTCGVTVVTTVAAALGLTGATGQSSAPTTTTAIDSRSNCFIGGAASSCTPYRIGTVANAGTFFMPLLSLHTGALTVDTGVVGFIDVGGLLVVPPGSWCSIAASATASTTVAQLGLIWAEVPA